MQTGPMIHALVEPQRERKDNRETGEMREQAQSLQSSKEPERSTELRVLVLAFFRLLRVFRGPLKSVIQ
ncbi:MAG: hypothetical protein KDA85_17660 [Planctomycetaceae bacterium]|nr:hypothetical protein [Planctomycetaceae bacterium]